MERSRRVALVAHCLLNANSKAAGVADYPGVHPVIAELASQGFGIVQLPCPELGIGGLGRAPRSRDDYDTQAFRQHGSALAEPIVEQVREYQAAGYEVGPLIGIEGSPSCGVTQTSAWADLEPNDEARSERVVGAGVWIEILRDALAPLGVEFVAMDHREPDGGVSRIALD